MFKRPWTFSSRSEQRLAEVHPELVHVVRHALEISEVDFAIVEGRRGLFQLQVEE